MKPKFEIWVFLYVKFGNFHWALRPFFMPEIRMKPLSVGFSRQKTSQKLTALLWLSDEPAGSSYGE